MTTLAVVATLFGAAGLSCLAIWGGVASWRATGRSQQRKARDRDEAQR